MSREIIGGYKKIFLYYRSLCESTFDQLSDEYYFIKLNEESNSIATIVQHLHGNMLSRRTDFLNTDGEKEWRERDKEFMVVLSESNEVLKKWHEGWNCLLPSLDSLVDSDLDRIVYIRNEGHTVREAICRQLAHYPYHIGQIVFIGKMFKNKDWKSLSIPSGQSAEFNAIKFAKQKNKAHYTDDHINT